MNSQTNHFHFYGDSDASAAKQILQSLNPPKMTKHTRRLATNQSADGDGNGADMDSGWVPLGDWAESLHIDIVAESAPGMTVALVAETIDAKEVTLHTEAISAAVNKSINLGLLPYTKIKAVVSDYSAGNLWVTANFL